MSFRKSSLLPFAVAGLAVLAGACTAESPPEGRALLTERDAVTIMTFNVENLFDNRDDLEKNDDTYLPLIDKQSPAHRDKCAKIEVERWREQCLNWDWNDTIVDRKLAIVAATILQVKDGRGPDIVALQEVENQSILERLRRDYLAEADYLPALLIEGRDARGIDVAFLTRLPLAEPATLYPIEFDGAESERVADTRGILEATFELPDGTLLTGYAVHFPAPFHPTAMRTAAYEALNELANALPAGRPAFAAGDFNTTSAEDRSERLLERYVRPHWTVAHEVGCDGCPGTSYYARTDEWSFLDMILWSSGAEGGEKATWELRADSVRIANGVPAQVRPDGTPRRFEMPDGKGVSDHWPLVITIETE